MAKREAPLQWLPSRGTLVVLWAVPCIAWVLLVFWLKQSQPHALESVNVASAIYQLGQIYIPTFTIMLTTWFPETPGKLYPITKGRFWIAALALLVWALLSTVYFWTQVFNIDYELAESCDDFFEARLDSFSSVGQAPACRLLHGAIIESCSPLRCYAFFQFSAVRQAGACPTKLRHTRQSSASFAQRRVAFIVAVCAVNLLKQWQ